MEMKHTPGPWKWWTSNSWKRLMHQRAIDAYHIRVLEPYVCSDGCPDVSIDEADMHLIAAAPDLLEALKMLYAEDADYITRNNLGAMDNQCMRMARAAIAKAEGN